MVPIPVCYLYETPFGLTIIEDAWRPLSAGAIACSVSPTAVQTIIQRCIGYFYPFDCGQMLYFSVSHVGVLCMQSECMLHLFFRPLLPFTDPSHYWLVPWDLLFICPSPGASLLTIPWSLPAKISTRLSPRLRQNFGHFGHFGHYILYLVFGIYSCHSYWTWQWRG